MDCARYYGQVVRLQGFKDVADDFVRVHFSQIENLDLNVFEFDLDLTMMIFFMNADGKLYARYGGRDAENADNRQSLAGLRYTMHSVLEMHRRENKEFAPLESSQPKYIRQFASRGFGRRRCIHCHDAKEMIYADARRKGKWNKDLVHRYPPPDNLGFVLDVDKSNVVKKIAKASPAAKLGLQVGDVVKRLNGVPIHSFGDAQFALDRAPKTGNIDISWERAGKTLNSKLQLLDGWRGTDISWRPSVWRWVPSPHIYGDDLTVAEKKALGLSAKHLAYRPRTPLHSHARAAGIKEGDIILGIDDKKLETDVNEFYYHVRGNYIVGDQIDINVLRDGKRLKVAMKLIR